MSSFFHPGLGSIMKLSDAETRSVSAENVYGRKGQGGMADPNEMQAEVGALQQPWRKDGASRELGRKWKVRPCLDLPANSITTIMDVDGPAIIQHLWITMNAKFHRDLILRFFWDGETTPSVEVPLGDFFCNGWKRNVDILALPINVNPMGGFNCYFPMPFRKHAKVTIENRAPEAANGFFYTFNYALTPVADDDAYFHAQFRRSNPLPYMQDHVILDGIKGKGHYVGTYLAWQQNSNCWWGEGEFKVFLDGDTEYPTICGTGTEDYAGGAWSFNRNYSAPFLGYPEGDSSHTPVDKTGKRHGIYRFHILDPIRFHRDLKVVIQALGWRSEGRYLPLQDDIASTAYWYQAEPHSSFPVLGNRDALEVI